MPRSENRRTVEIPTPLYDELKAEAEREGTTMSVIVQRFIATGRGARAPYGQIAEDVRAAKDEGADEAHALAAIAAHQEELARRIEPLMPLATQFSRLTALADQMGPLTSLARQMSAVTKLTEQLAPLAAFAERLEQIQPRINPTATAAWALADSPAAHLAQSPTMQMAQAVRNNPLLQATLGNPTLQAAQRLQGNLPQLHPAAKRRTPKSKPRPSGSAGDDGQG